MTRVRAALAGVYINMQFKYSVMNQFRYKFLFTYLSGNTQPGAKSPNQHSQLMIA